MKSKVSLNILSKTAIATIAAFSLSGCLLSNSGGGGGGGAAAGAGGAGAGGGANPGVNYAALSSAEVQQRVNDIQTKGFTATSEPLTGTAEYRGNVYLNAIASLGQPVPGEVIGDVDVDINFAQGAQNPIQGKIDNFRGTLNGTAVDIAGELVTGPENGQNINRVVAQTTNVNNAINNLPGAPNVNIPNVDITTTNITVDFRGTLTDNSGTGLGGDAWLSLSGPVMGPALERSNHQAIFGGVAGGIDGEPVIIGGQYYLERQ